MKLFHLLHPPIPLPSFSKSTEGYNVAGLRIEPRGLIFAEVGRFSGHQIAAPVPAVAEPSTLGLLLCGLAVVAWRLRR